MESVPKATLLMINYNGRPDLEELLNSLAVQSTEDFDPIFLDNASQDGSVDYVREHFPWVKVWAQETNLGYATAANIGTARFPTEYTIFLNTDIKMEPDCIEQLIAVADSDPRIACVAAKMRLFYQPEYLNGVGGAMNYMGYTWDRGMFELDEGQYDQVEDVIFACGGAALVRRSAFLDARGYDTGFYMYHEDVDLCWRFWLLGHRVVTAPQSVVYHKFSRSTRDNRGMTWRELIGERNNVRAMIKNYETRTLIRSIRDLLRQPRKPERRKQMLRNLRWNVLHLPQTLWHRSFVQRRRRVTDAQLAHLIDPSPEVPVDTSGFTLGEIKSF